MLGPEWGRERGWGCGANSRVGGVGRVASRSGRYKDRWVLEGYACR